MAVPSVAGNVRKTTFKNPAEMDEAYALMNQTEVNVTACPRFQLRSAGLELRMAHAAQEVAFANSNLGHGATCKRR